MKTKRTKTSIEAITRSLLDAARAEGATAALADPELVQQAKEAEAYRRIRAGLNMEAEGASPEEVIEEVRRCHVTARITPWAKEEARRG